MRNYYIGIGGTGARLAEALLHLCGAGLGPSHLTLFLIDPDQGNGNLARTQALATAYKAARDSIRDRADASVDLLSTQVTLPDPFVWHVFQTKGVTLGAHLNLSTLQGQQPELAGFAETLFSPTELNTPLDQGFRGHPNIGAVVLSDIPSTDDPWRTFWTDVQTAQTEGEVQVFLAGSVFGGTGAAGLPTLGNPAVLKQDPRVTLGGGRSKIRLGSALVLPYFTVPPPTSDHDGQMFVTSADFPIAAKAALDYYAEKPLAFDDVYLLGDSLAQPVGAFSAGNATQENAPHYIELVGALAALDFYRSPKPASPVVFHASRASAQLSWDDLPASRDEGRFQEHLNQVKEQIATFTTFAHAYLGYALNVLDQPPGDLADVWHREHFYPKGLMGFGHDKTKDPRLNRQPLDNLAAYLRLYLDWITALDSDPAHVKLFDRTQITTNPLARGGQVVALAERTSSLGTGVRLTSVTYTAPQNAFSVFKNVLDQTDVRNQPTDAVSNSDRFVNLFHKASRTFARANYRLASGPSA